MAENEVVQYKTAMSQIEEIPGQDDLVASLDVRADKVTIKGGAELSRGQVLMSGAEGFVPVTAEGIAGADELCILAEDSEIPEGIAGEVAAYFAGVFTSSRVLLWDDADIESVRGTLRKHGIFIA